MSLLGASDLAMMRDIIDETLPDVCNILGESLTSDGQGGVTSTWGVTAGTIACRLDSVAKSNQGLTLVGESVRPEREYTLSLPYNTAIATGDRVEIGAYTFTTTSVNEGISWEAVKRATLKIYSRDAEYEFDFSTATDGAMPAEFTGATWAISGGKSINTPALSGTELLTNGDMETGNPPTGWAVGGGSTLAGAADERTGGTGVQSLNIARGTSDTGASKSTSGGQIGWHKMSGYVKNIDATFVGLFPVAGSNSMSAQTAATAWHTASCSLLVSPAAGIGARLLDVGTAGKQVRYDDVSLQKLVTADLFSTVDRGLSDFNIVAPAIDTTKTGMQSGLVLCLDSAITPANYVAVYYFNNLSDATTKLFVVQLVAGTYTTLASTSVAYGATKFISAKKVGNQLSVFYGTAEFGTQIGSTVTINAALVSNTRHGLFSTDSGNTFSGLFRLERYSTLQTSSAGAALSVVYGGSSITNTSTGYRALSEAWLRGTYPNTTITAHNGSVSGEDSTQNYARINTDYLPYAPDLVIFDDANDTPGADNAAAESLVRDIWTAYPLCKFVFMKVFTVTANTPDSYIDTPTTATRTAEFEALATYYGIPLVPVWDTVQDDVTAGKYHLSDYLIDTVHPTMWGHGVMEALLEPYLTASFLTTRQSPTTLPARLY